MQLTTPTFLNIAFILLAFFSGLLHLYPLLRVKSFYSSFLSLMCYSPELHILTSTLHFTWWTPTMRAEAIFSDCRPEPGHQWVFSKHFTREDGEEK